MTSFEQIIPKHYIIHPDGRLFNSRKKEYLNGSISRAGYLRYTISVKKYRFRVSAHRLVAIKFIPNPEGFPIINHKDGNKLNNNVSNLEWCNQSHNVKHAYKVCGKKANKTGLGKFSVLHSRSKKIAQISSSGELIKIWDCAADIKRELGWSRGNICNCARGESKSAYGFKWAYQ
jgi:hypothetical protein